MSVSARIRKPLSSTPITQIVDQILHWPGFWLTGDSHIGQEVLAGSSLSGSLMPFQRDCCPKLKVSIASHSM